jgi:O-methyltransferase
MSEEYGILGAEKSEVVRGLATAAGDLDGAAAEVGVYQGHTSRIIARALPDRKVFCFDTFSGCPNADLHDVHVNGDFADTSLEQVRQRLRDCPNAIVRQGYFPETAVDLPEKFCFVHVDGDTYRTTLDAIDVFWPRLVPGGYLVFDDWDWIHCPGVNQAIAERLPDIQRLHPTRNQAVLRKPAAGTSGAGGV